MSDIQINLVGCADAIKQDIAGGATQKDVAVTYAMAIKSLMQGVERPDWSIINGAILAKWKMSGLERIKKRAIDILNGKIQP